MNENAAALELLDEADLCDRLDEEQLQLGSSDRFWALISQRRKEKAISRAELEQKIRSQDGG